MAYGSDPSACKESFMQENKSFTEIELTNESKPIGKLHEFDLLENEIWFLQCPKGMDVTELKNRKLKMPGRTNVNSSEAVSMEFIEGKEQHAFAYCRRKERYAIRLLPVKGTIIVRDRLKAAAIVTEERAEECCPPVAKVPMPASIRVRHPLLGVRYEDKLELDKSIVERLQNADKTSAPILKASLSRRSKTKLEDGLKNVAGNERNVISPIEIDSTSEIDVEFEEKIKKKKKNKREHRKSNGELHVCDDTSKNKIKKSKKSNVNQEFVPKDLQWLQYI